MSQRPDRRRLWVPEVIQTSATDCGPACMTSLLTGFGIPADYEQLRDACYTDVEGTSIDDLEDVAVRAGLDAHQTMVPPEHLLARGSGVLPAIAVLALPGGTAHFVVLWRRVGAWFQVMDPMSGRRWIHRRHLLDVLYRHRTAIDADTWRAWAGGDAFVEPLRDRMRRIGLPRETAGTLLAEALSDDTWRSIATLDALVRLVESVFESRGRSAGAEAAALLGGLRGDLAAQASWVPERFFTAHGDHGTDELVLSGAVLVTASERTTTAPAGEAGFIPRRGVLAQLVSYLRADGALAPAVLAAVAALAGCAAAFEALLFKGVLELAGLVYTPEQRVGAVVAVAVFAAAALVIDLRLAAGVRALGRRVETRLRIDFLRKLARLPDSFFSRRLTSDLTLRIHSVVQLRGLPGVAESILRSFFALLVTGAGIIWIDPGCAPLVVGALAAAIGLPLLFQSRLSELQLAVATYRGGLSRYLLDALLGALPLRAHVGQQVLRAEHDRLLGRWIRARRDVIRSSVLVATAISATGVLAAALILHSHLARAGSTSSVLLLLFWAHQLPVLGRALARSLFEYPARRAAGARILEPINNPDEPRREDEEEPRRESAGARVAFHDVNLDVGRARVLADIDLTLEPGCHCAVVGSSGAGKTSLIGLLMGWHRATAGEIRIDRRSLDECDRERLFEQIAWIDPQVQLWNRSLHDNLTYGSSPGNRDLAEAIEAAGLGPTIDKLPGGLGAILEEGGSALSQGEAQRVRIARALLDRQARLVLLDEPFRGLDRDTRASLMRRVRAWWPDATMLCVTHDLHETLDFDRVLVVDQAHVVEDGRPVDLARRPGSLYARMLESERRIRAFFDESPMWRRWVMQAGRLQTRGPREPRAAEPSSAGAEAAS